ncbi:MAG: hypothetical protein L0323_11565 [Planctomycetes bacterium]|nr:hypothetical protein [Planctomycetota bacterium]
MLTFAVAPCVLFALQASQPGTELLPPPTGPHGTGRMSFHWKDAAREELETLAGDDKRELMVHVFYPADPEAKEPRATYMPDADAMRPPFSEAQLAAVSALRATSLQGAALPPGDARFPVVLFQPGGGMKGLTYHTLCEDLASHGWVVAAIDPPYNARSVRFPDGRVLGGLRPAERGWKSPHDWEENLRNYKERIVHWTNDAAFVIDRLADLDRGEGPLAKRLDLARGVGIAGHSRGGQAAGTVRMLDARVRGGINIDGTQGPYPFQPVKGEEVSGEAPFLWIQQPLPPPPSEERLKQQGKTRADYEAEIEKITGTWHRRLEAIAGGAAMVTFARPGIAHIDFSDEPLWDVGMSAEDRAGKLATIADTRVWVRAFFDGAVRGDWEPFKKVVAEAGKSRPEIRAQVFGKLWP